MTDVMRICMRCSKLHDSEKKTVSNERPQSRAHNSRLFLLCKYLTSTVRNR